MPKIYNFPNPSSIFLCPWAKSCRYNINGFVEELPQLPENRLGHACAALSDVGPVQSTFNLNLWNVCRLLWLPEDSTDPRTFLLYWPSSLGRRPGLPLPPSHEHCPALELWLWEEGSEWRGVTMMENPTDLRWWLKSDASDAGYETMIIAIWKTYKCWTWISFACQVLDYQSYQYQISNITYQMSNITYQMSILNQVLEYRPQPWNQWVQVGDLEQARHYHEHY